MDDLRVADVDFLTLGQYLQPTVKHAAVDRLRDRRTSSRTMPGWPGPRASCWSAPRRSHAVPTTPTPTSRVAETGPAASPSRPPDADPRRTKTVCLPARADSSTSWPMWASIRSSCRGASAPVSGAHGTELVADLTIGFGPFRESFTSRVMLERPTRIRVRYENGPFRYLNNQWKFAPIPRDAGSISSSTSSSRAACCRPPSASCSTRPYAVWSMRSSSGRGMSMARRSPRCMWRSRP